MSFLLCPERQNHLGKWAHGHDGEMSGEKCGIVETEGNPGWLPAREAASRHMKD
jgi:hypothetical protein